MGKNFKKILAAVVSAAMICLPMGVLAADENVASVDATEYATLQEAINQANGKTVTLLTDVTESVTIPEGTTITLDLVEFTLTNTDKQDTITNNGTLTVTGNGTVDNVSHAKTALQNNGTAVLNGGTFDRSKEAGKNESDSGENSYYTIVNHGTMTIKDGTTVKQNGKFSSLLENGWYNGNQNTGKQDSVLNIEGGHFTGGLNTIKNDDYGQLHISGGTFENVAQAALLNWNTATITGGTFQVDTGSNCVVLNGYLNDSMDKGELTISGGTFSGGVDVLQTMGGSTNSGTIKISNGTFNGNIKLGLTASASAGNLEISGSAVINGDVINTQQDSVVINGGTITGTINKTGNGTMQVNSGNFSKQPNSAYVNGASTVAKYTTDDVATFIVGSASDVANQLSNAVKGDKIEIMQGDAEITVTEGVSVSNTGTGTVTVNGETVTEEPVVTPHVHGNIIHVDAKAPTATQAGNIEYWLCPDCGKYFSDKALTKEITEEDTILAATGETSNPSQPANPDNSGSGTQVTPDDTTSTPQTGDSSNLAVWVVLTVLAGASIVKAALSVKHAK